MGNFDPDAFLERTKSAHSVGGGFDPDAFLAKNTTVAAPPVEPGSDVPPVAPEDDPNSFRSYVNSGLHAAGKGFTFGLGDEAQGWGAAATTPIVNAIQGQPVWQGFGQLMKEYRGARDSARATDAAAAADHPWLSTGVELAAGLPAAIATGGSTAGLGGGAKVAQLMKIGAGLGGLTGFGNSDADLTSGKIGDVARASGDTVLGATTGALAARFPKIAGAALGATGLATGNPVLAVAGGLGAASGLVGEAGNKFASWSRGAASEALEKPQAEIASLDEAAQKAGNRNRLTAESADAAAHRAEAQHQGYVAGQGERAASLTRNRNAQYQRQLAKMAQAAPGGAPEIPEVTPEAAPAPEVVAPESETGTEPTRVNPVYRRLQTLADQEEDLPARVAGRRANEFGLRNLRKGGIVGKDPDEAAMEFQAAEQHKIDSERKPLWNQIMARAPAPPPAQPEVAPPAPAPLAPSRGPTARIAAAPEAPAAPAPAPTARMRAAPPALGGSGTQKYGTSAAPPTTRLYPGRLPPVEPPRTPPPTEPIARNFGPTSDQFASRPTAHSPAAGPPGPPTYLDPEAARGMSPAEIANALRAKLPAGRPPPSESMAGIKAPSPLPPAGTPGRAWEPGPELGAPAPAAAPPEAAAPVEPPPAAPSPEMERAIALAKSLGLDPGDVARFDPKAVLPILEDPAVTAARSAKRAALQQSADAARSKSDAAQAALERATPQGEKALKLMLQIEDPNYVRNLGAKKLIGGALKGGAFGLIGGPHGAIGGAALGALHAAATDPAARAVLFGAVNKALLGSPALRARAGSYLVPLLSQQSGRSTAAILDAIQKDPELKRAVETAASGAGGR